MLPSLVDERRFAPHLLSLSGGNNVFEKDMRMKFDESQDPSEVNKTGKEGVDRSQGAARAISVCSDYQSAVKH